jgi:hypothetical protein
MNKLKANTVKLMINSFANGDLRLVKQFHAEYGNLIFDFVPRIKSGNFHRLIFYSLKNGHFDVINFYLSVFPTAKIGEDEIRIICDNIAHKSRFLKWFEGYELSKKLQSKIDYDILVKWVSYCVVSRYDLELIDQFLDKFPDKFQVVISSCGTSAKAIQLRRHLQLKQLV